MEDDHFWGSGEPWSCEFFTSPEYAWYNNVGKADMVKTPYIGLPSSTKVSS